MTALFEMRIRLGGDPGSFDEFNVLRGELAKLDHPACPDVDWAKVEALCLRLFERNGVELQTAVSFILARSYRTGLAGLTEGVAFSLPSRTSGRACGRCRLQLGWISSPGCLLSCIPGFECWNGADRVWRR